MTGELATQVGELRRRQESHREAQAALSRAEHEALNQLTAAVRAPELRDDGAVSARTDGLRTPVPLKLPGLLQSGAPSPGSRARSLSWLRRALLPHRQDPRARADPAQRRPGRACVRKRSSACTGPCRSPRASGATRLPVTIIEVSPAQPTPELAVHLFGSLHVAVDDVAVDDWPSARCRSLFGYLLTHREPWPPARC